MDIFSFVISSLRLLCKVYVKKCKGYLLPSEARTSVTILFKQEISKRSTHARKKSDGILFSLGETQHAIHSKGVRRSKQKTFLLDFEK